ncbi:MAG: hypothetical protein A2W95_14070 [Bacteroidetes bacterium GWA2_40_14]|nr:MAG: hypothetical protein A2W95_14070 [Bacteroidetes bacterium GWA2_40_14]HAZ01317.1 hypothetical protein [Marinilabiliales bacterium]
MKKLLLFALLGSLLLPIQSFSQKRKVKESSEKKQPEWVNGLVKDYIIVVSSGQTLEDAQQKCLAKVKEQIISSVAENIQTSSEYFRSENIQNNNSQFTENFQTATKTRAADIPFIKGISLTNVAAYYWEKVEEGDALKFYYHIKYPFSQAQLKALIIEFEKADKALTEQLEGLLAKIDELTNMEEMGQTVKELEALANGFIDVDPRKDKANVGIAKLKEMLKNFSIETVNNTLGEVRMTLKIGEKTVNTSKKPKVRSNCAKITDVRAKGNEWVVTYTYDECYEDPANSIVAEFLNSYGKATSTFYFNINSDKIDIFVNDDINLTGGSDSGTEVSGVKCHISLTSKYATPFMIEKVILNFGNEAPIIIENLNLQFTGEGKHDLDFTIDQNLLKETYSSKKYGMIKGSIQYKSVKTGETSIYKMYNQDITTSW